jgi:hypothetical protein
MFALAQVVILQGMFPYDPQIATAAKNRPQDIQEVITLLQTIDAICQDTDGLKWFNWLYLAVTQAIKAKIDAGTFQTGTWLTQLDVHFAGLYAAAVYGSLTSGVCPVCWQVVLSKRNLTDIARIQFAMAGMIAHIGHDLPQGLVSTCLATNVVPQHGIQQYAGYNALNPVLDSVIDPAKRTALPILNHVEDAVAAISLAEFRENSWDTAESMWTQSPIDQAKQLGRIDFRDRVMNDLLLIPAP